MCLLRRSIKFFTKEKQNDNKIVPQETFFYSLKSLSESL